MAHLVLLVEEPGWDFLVKEETRIKEVARDVLGKSTDVHEMCRAQGILKGFYDRDMRLSQILLNAKLEKQQEVLDESKIDV